MKQNIIIFNLIIIVNLLSGLDSFAQSEKTSPFGNLKWRHLGPTVFGGRIPDIEVAGDDPFTIYVAGSTGGIFKSENNGVTWRSIFDDAGSTLSIGDMAVSPSDPLVIWVGTGESNGEQNPASLGDGVYRSLDGGETWENLGLKDTRHIHRIAVHPDNPDIAFVAATGHRWGPNEERGLYRTTDGGKVWEKVLYISENTGVVEVVMEDNGRVLYAASYTRRRTAWGIVSAGPEAAIYRSLDGGDSWQKLGEGIPEGNLGKIGLAIAKSKPNIVYATIGGSRGGLFRSEDRGNNWEKVNNIRTSYWYGNIYVDPENENKVWMMGTMLDLSIDGGKTFDNTWTARNIHVDHHCMWINPENTDHMLLGNDGGFYITYDGAKNWDFINNIPIAQYYAIGLDNRDPFWVYGGLQDNGTWGIPSRTYDNMGILNEDAVIVGGGDGFVPAIDPRDHSVVYSEWQFGNLNIVDLKTRESKPIKPVPEDTTETYRFTWNSPLLISPHDPDVVYFGGNKLFKTVDRGENWEVLSPDLTKNEKKEDWTILDMKPSHRAYNAITMIAESPILRGLIYVGTDDGLVHVTKDEGKTWDNVTEKIHLDGPDKYVTRIYASVHDPETAYLSYTGHFNDDYRPYLFRTTDMGRSWNSIAGDIPGEAIVKTVVEHPEDKDILFAGIHNGLLVSMNGGRNWTRAAGNLPPVSVDDIEIKNGDLVLGTYGRGIMIMDDIDFLAELNSGMKEQNALLFPVRDTEKFYRTSRRMFPGVSEFLGENPEYGAMITYYLEDGWEAGKEEDDSALYFQILDSEGNEIRSLEGPKSKGVNRIVWDLRKLDKSAKNPSGNRNRRPRYLNVETGVYTVKLSLGGKELSSEIKVIADKRK